jgi:serine protease Do
MKTKLITTIAAIALLPLAGFTQAVPNPSAAPNPPQPPQPPHPPGDWFFGKVGPNEKLPKVPVTFLGVETSQVPSVVSEQLGLPKGFGLVVDYVVPDGPAAAAGIKQNDILKMLNDQILTEPDQLAKLVRSYSEGTSVTFTLLRKGKEEKVPVKLGKRDVPQRPDFGPGRHRHSHFQFDDHDFGDFGMSDLNERMQALKERLGDERRGLIHDAVMKAHEEAMRATEQARRAAEEARREGRVWVTRSDENGLKATKIDIGKARIVYSDDKGELRVEKIDGKKVLTAKDPKGLLLFSGPVETKEDLDKVPPDVRQRYEKLQQHDLPAAMSSQGTDESNDSDVDENDQRDDETTQSLDTISI